jgi:hypothetical protein
VQASKTQLTLSASHFEAENPAFEPSLANCSPPAITVIAGLACLDHCQGGQLVEVERHYGSILPPRLPPRLIWIQPDCSGAHWTTISAFSPMTTDKKIHHVVASFLKLGGDGGIRTQVTRGF